MAWTAEQKRKHADGMKKYWAARKAGKAGARLGAKASAKSAGGKYRCPKCGKSFGMAAHLGRHMTTIHGQLGKMASKRAQLRPALATGLAIRAPARDTSTHALPNDALIALRRRIDQELADRVVRGEAR